MTCISKKKCASSRLLTKNRVSQVFWEPIKNRVCPRSVLLEAVYLKALLYNINYLTIWHFHFFILVFLLERSQKWHFSSFRSDPRTKLEVLFWLKVSTFMHSFLHSFHYLKICCPFPASAIWPVRDIYYKTNT